MANILKILQAAFEADNKQLKHVPGLAQKHMTASLNETIQLFLIDVDVRFEEHL